MGASFRNINQIKALAGIDKFIIDTIKVIEIIKELQSNINNLHHNKFIS